MRNAEGTCPEPVPGFLPDHHSTSSFAFPPVGDRRSPLDLYPLFVADRKRPTAIQRMARDDLACRGEQVSVALFELFRHLRSPDAAGPCNRPLPRRNLSLPPPSKLIVPRLTPLAKVVASQEFPALSISHLVANFALSPNTRIISTQLVHNGEEAGRTRYRSRYEDCLDELPLAQAR